MRILAIHRYFWPDIPPYASFLRSIGRRWVDEGHCVEVLTAHPAYTPDTQHERRPTKEVVDGLRISRVPVFNELGRLPGQLFNLVVFPVQAACRVLIGPKRDMVMCSTAPQVTLGYFVSWAARLRALPFIYHCMDLHPEIGRLSHDFSNPVVYRILSAMDRTTMRRATRIVVLSEDMKAAVVNRDASVARKIEVLNNFSLPDNSDVADLPLPYPAPGVLRIVFTGNIGRFQGLEAVVKAVGLASERCPVELVLMGEGKAKVGLQIAASSPDSGRAGSVIFLPHGSPARAKALMQTAHLGLVCLAPRVIRYAYPSKTATYANEGLPMLVICDQDSGLARDVRQKGLGLTAAPGDVLAIVESVTSAAKMLHEGRFQSWRKSTEQFAVQNFDEAMILDKWSELARDIDEKVQ